MVRNGMHQQSVKRQLTFKDIPDILKKIEAFRGVTYHEKYEQFK